jgi:hypothetical protein
MSRRSDSSQCLPYSALIFQYCDRTLFFRFETNFNTVKGACPVGKLILESQSKNNLLQLSVPQVPLFLQPFGDPPSEVEQLVHAIFYI